MIQDRKNLVRFLEAFGATFVAAFISDLTAHGQVNILSADGQQVVMAAALTGLLLAFRRVVATSGQDETA